MSNQNLVIGTRGSALALWQAGHVADRLRALVPDLAVEVKRIKTHGDVVRDRALSQVGGKGLFVKEIEAALLDGEIDLAVHSLKDMPTGQPEGLTLGAILERADARDALVVRKDDRAGSAGGLRAGLAVLVPGARIGTSSLRRRAQLLSARPDLQVLDLRGNVNTRLRKLFDGEYNAVVLAAAGLIRLGHGGTVTEYLPLDVMLPAVGQGALCVECRTNDEATQALVSALDHAPTRRAAEAERALLRRLEGGCQVPIGAYAGVKDDGSLVLRGLVASLDGSRVIRDAIRGPAGDAARLGTDLAGRLLAAGAGQILEEISGGRSI
jgi:hydroxymethylbilane synthase